MMTDYIGDARGFYLHWWDEPIREFPGALRDLLTGRCLEPVNTLEEAQSVAAVHSVRLRRETEVMLTPNETQTIHKTRSIGISSVFEIKAYGGN